MSMQRLAKNILILGMVLISGFVPNAQQDPPNRTASATKQRHCSLPDVLWEIANKYDIYFTIEIDNLGWQTQTGSTAWHLAVYSQPFNEHCDYLQQGATDANRELLAIQADIPVFGYAVDRFNPKVVHVFDNRLVNQAGYPMSKIVGPLEFKGTAAELVYYLHRQGVDIGFGTLFDASGDPKYEPRAIHAHRTPLKLDLQAASVREVLSQFTPANKTERILWTSVATTPKPDSVAIHFGYRWYKDHVYAK
jgi:hypothetical protein